MEPPAEIEQYSNRPSKTGQSSATLTASRSQRQLAVATRMRMYREPGDVHLLISLASPATLDPPLPSAAASTKSGVTRPRKSTYSSVWNCAISLRVAGFARCVRGSS